MFITRPQLKIKVEQSKSSLINLNLVGFGNFLLFESENKQQDKTTSNILDNDVRLKVFEDLSIDVGLAPGQFIKAISSIRNLGRTIYFVNTDKQAANMIFIREDLQNKTQHYMTLKDHRLLTGVEYIDNNNYLLAIGQLIYQVKLDVKVYEPIYKSDDLCGKISTIMVHNKLGKMMICGG